MSLLSSCTLGGIQVKFLEGGYVYKEDLLGYESISEALVSEFETYIKDINFVNYALERRGNSFLCKSKNILFTGDVVSFPFLSEIIGSYNRGNYLCKYSGRDLKNYVVDSVLQVTGIDIEDYLARIIYLDCITLNEDRHLGNINLIKGVNGFKEGIIFDNGLSLLSDLSKYPLNGKINRYIVDARSRPFSTNFMMQRGYFKTKPLEIDIKAFFEKLELIEENLEYVVPFKVDCYKRALSVLMRRLRVLKDDVWVESAWR